MPLNNEHLASLTDADVVDERGDKIGGVGQIYLDDATGQPAWVSVKSGLFGMRESFVPLAGADVVDGDIQVPYTKDFVKDAPRVDADNHLDDGQQATLFSYYGVERGAGQDAGQDAAGPAAGDAAGGVAGGAAGGVGGAADPRATYGSEATADDLARGTTTGEPTAPATPVTDSRDGDSGERDSRDGAVTSEYTTPGTSEEAAAHGSEAAYDGNDLGSGDLAAGDVAAERPVPSTDEPYDQVHATFQQDNPQARADWESPSPTDPEPTTQWTVPDTDPATEEHTEVSRSGYSADRPAAHSSAYEGHGETAAGAAAAGAAAAGAAGVGAAAAGAAAPADSGEPVAAPVDDQGIGSVQPVTSDGPDIGSTTGDHAEFERIGDEAALAEAEGRPTEGDPQGPDASATESAPYEVPGAERGDPIGTDPSAAAAVGAAFAVDMEDEGAEHEEFGPQGYRPDRDGTEMTDEERERLNRARGAL